MHCSRKRCSRAVLAIRKALALRCRSSPASALIRATRRARTCCAKRWPAWLTERVTTTSNARRAYVDPRAHEAGSGASRLFFVLFFFLVVVIVIVVIDVIIVPEVVVVLVFVVRLAALLVGLQVDADFTQLGLEKLEQLVVVVPTPFVRSEE